MSFSGSNISYSYPEATYPTLNNITFELKQPGFHALFGPSGVGKTSLAGILAGMTMEYEGNLNMSGKCRILYTHNQEELPGWSSIKRHFSLITPEEQKETVAALTAVCGIEEILDSRFSRLSHGQKNRVNLIRYLVQPFDLLIMDESLANVDETMRREILLDIKERFPDHFFLYISHNLIEVATFCQSILVLRDSVKAPQLHQVNGLDLKKNETINESELDRVLLKVMNHAS